MHINFHSKYKSLHFTKLSHKAAFINKNGRVIIQNTFCGKVIKIKHFTTDLWHLMSTLKKNK